VKVSLNWVKQFTDIDLPVKELVDRIGRQLGAVEEVIDVGKRYHGIVVVRVVDCQKHASANKLTICLVDDGGVVKKIPRDSQGYVQIVCGAQNVKVGMLAAWIPPGSIVPSTQDKEPLTIESREIRQAISHGMLASPAELGFGNDHSGLLAIDEDIEVGSSFASTYRLDDYIIDIENKMFTHRPDLFGMLGVAREMAAISGGQFNSPGWYLNPTVPTHKPGEGSLVLQVKNELPNQAPRFCVVAIADVTVGPSPIWLQSYLMRIGVKPINSVVDVANFVMHETGQPLHVYDYDKLAGNTLIVRRSTAGETLKLLGDKVIKLDGHSIVIADRSGVIGLGGIMGGAKTEVDEQSRNIVLECANFDMNSIRRSAMNYGLFTDAATRFTKNPSPLQIINVIAKATEDILRIAGGRVASPLIDNYPTKQAGASSIKTTLEFINSRLGLDLTSKQMAQLLGRVEINCRVSGGSLVASVPFWRTDLAIAEDLSEEIGRLNGYDQIPARLPTRDLSPARPDTSWQFAQRIRELFSQCGASELLTYSFVDAKLIDSAGQDSKRAYHIRNSISPALQYYRLSILPSLLEKVHPNVKLGADEMILYELGSVHIKGIDDKDGLPQQLDRIGIVTAERSANKDSGAAYFRAKFLCDFLASQLGVGPVTYRPLSDSKKIMPAWRDSAGSFELSRSAEVLVGGKIAGLIGEPSTGLRQALKLPAFTAQLELDLSVWHELTADHLSYQPLGKYPALGFDLCLRSPTTATYASQEDFLHSHLSTETSKHGYSYRLRPISIYQSSQSSRHKQTTWHIDLWHEQRTLTSLEVNELVSQLAKAAQKKIGASVV